MQRLTVTNLHLCQHCPRLLAYSLEDEKFVWMVGNKGTGKLKGTLFHEFAKTTLHDIGNNVNTNTDLIHALSQDKNTCKNYFNEVVKNQYLIPFFSKNIGSMSPDNITAFASATEMWISYLFQYIEPIVELYTPEVLIDMIFHNVEVLISSEYLFPDGFLLKIRGKPDSLLFDPISKEAVVVEYKGRKESDATQDLAQTSLYAWLVKQSTGICPRVDILYLEEDEPLVTYSAESIEEIIKNHSSLFTMARRIIQKELPIPKTSNPNLCVTCRFKNSCDTDYGSQEKPYPEPNVHQKAHEHREITDELSTDAEKFMSMLVERLNMLNVPVIPQGYVIGPRFIRLKVSPDVSKKVTFSKIANRVVDIQLGLVLSSQPLIKPQNGYIGCDIPYENWKGFDVSDLCKEISTPDTDKVQFPLGKKTDGTVLFGDIANPTMTSCLIGGTSGSGKSELLRSIVIGISLCNPPQMVTFTLIDPKRVTFTDFLSLPILHEPVILDPDKAMEALNRSVTEMEKRYLELEKTSCTNIAEYNSKKCGFFTRRVIIIDEYADLIMNKSTKETLEANIQRIGQKGRAAGFHLFLATQRPDAKIVTGVIKANLQLKIALKVTSATNSKIILDESGAECLVGHGDMLIGGSVQINRLQGSRVSKRDIAYIMNHYSNT
ncbi:MAG: hypothetical protein GXY48_05255 [Methanomicrobiales archaeon]|nr:hypothetical protein [Methanomicrobiales archaeon]